MTLQQHRIFAKPTRFFDSGIGCRTRYLEVVYLIELRGRFNTAKVYAEVIERDAASQIINLLNQEFVKGSKIRIMPDVHLGIGCTIGTTMTIDDKVVPNLVGVDIGCGIETVLLKNKDVDLAALDRVIHKNIPSGFSVRKTAHSLFDGAGIKNLRCVSHVDINRARLSLGTLGGGNHFIELNIDDDERLYLVVHSGSRHLGKQVADYYQAAAAADLGQKIKHKRERAAELKRQSRAKEAESLSREMSILKVERALAFVEGELFEDYLHDMSIIQQFAYLNRLAIVQEIINKMRFETEEHFTTIHNYIDLEQMILRKGAVSAGLGEKLLVPINMRDGSLICTGKGNPEWNYSAPHGAGRLMSRRAARKNIRLEDFKSSMKGIYSSTVSKKTIDEAAFAYKPMEEIITGIADTAVVEKIIRPIYNFKAAD